MGNLINRYAAVLKKCRLLNVFGSLAMGFESKFFDHVPEYPDFVVGGVPDVGPPAEFTHNLKKEQTGVSWAWPTAPTLPRWYTPTRTIPRQKITAPCG